jgi:hypothetical protein
MPTTDLVACFYREQDDRREVPGKHLLRSEVRELRRQGLGTFENHGRTFRLFQSAPVSLRRADDRPHNRAKVTSPASDPCISHVEMQANVGIVSERVRNQRGFVKKAEAKVRWYRRVRTYPLLPCGRWALPETAQASA